MESKAEIILDNAEIIEFRYTEVRGKKPLEPARQKDFETLVEHFAEEIIQKWIDYFVLHKPVKTEKMTSSVFLRVRIKGCVDSPHYVSSLIPAFPKKYHEWHPLKYKRNFLPSVDRPPFY